MDNLISRQAAIYVEGLDEEIKCEMCRNPMRTNKGCDGNCQYDEKLYERIMQILDEKIKPLPSAESEPMCINLNEPIKVKLTDWGKTIRDERPLADSEVIPRLQDIKRQIGGSYAIERAIEVLEELPSAEPEIIRCRDCKHHDGIRCFRWNSTIITGFDDFCSNAERRTDE